MAPVLGGEDEVLEGVLDLTEEFGVLLKGGAGF